MIFEYFSKGKESKLMRRGAVYAALLYEKTGKNVDMVIIFTKNIADRNTEIRYGRNVFNPYFIVLPDKNAEEELEKIKIKHNRNIRLNKGDLFLLTTLPMMNVKKNEIELIKNTLKLINTINNLEIEEYERLMTRHQYLIKKFIKNDENQLVEISREMKKMQETIIKKYGEKKQEHGFNIGIKKGKKEGLKEGEINIAKKMLKENYPVNEIVKLTSLTEKEIMKIK